MSNDGTAERIDGIVLEWHATKGIGRIEDDTTGDVFFVHWTGLCPVRNPPVPGWKPVLQTGESVQFTPSTNPQRGPHHGKRTAIEITGAFGRPLMCDWVGIPRCSYRGDPRTVPDDAYDPSNVRTGPAVGTRDRGRGRDRGDRKRGRDRDRDRGAARRIVHDGSGSTGRGSTGHGDDGDDGDDAWSSDDQ
jgi:hypothetical protein